MIISNKYKFIYIAIPKTGSTSIKKFLVEVDPNCVESDSKIYPYGHYTASQIKSMISPTIWKTYFKFTFIRNPFEWYKSYYSFNCKTPVLLKDNFKLPYPSFNHSLTVSNIVNLYVGIKDSDQLY